MFSKLAVRNVVRSFRDYGVYLLTLTFGERTTKVKVLSVQEIVGKADAVGLYEELR